MRSQHPELARPLKRCFLLIERLCRLLLGPGLRLGARWNRLVETAKTHKKRGKAGKKWARYGRKRVKEPGSPREQRIREPGLVHNRSKVFVKVRRSLGRVDETVAVDRDLSAASLLVPQHVTVGDVLSPQRYLATAVSRPFLPQISPI